MTRRQLLRLVGAAAAAATQPRLAWAQAYPARMVRVIVPFAPGGQTDLIGRLPAQYLSEHFGEQYYVENKPGAFGNIGAGPAAQAAPDGYTMLVTDGMSFVANPNLYDRVPYDPFEDFAPAAERRDRQDRHPARGQAAVGGPRLRAVRPPLEEATARLRMKVPNGQTSFARQASGRDDMRDGCFRRILLRPDLCTRRLNSFDRYRLRQSQPRSVRQHEAHTGAREAAAGLPSSERPQTSVVSTAMFPCVARE